MFGGFGVRHDFQAQPLVLDFEEYIQKYWTEEFFVIGELDTGNVWVRMSEPGGCWAEGPGDDETTIEGVFISKKDAESGLEDEEDYDEYFGKRVERRSNKVKLE